MDTKRNLCPLGNCWCWWNCWSCFIVVGALGLLAVEISFDDIERNLIVKSLVLTNDSQTTKILTQKTIIDLQVHLFNITNSDDVIDLNAKPILQTVGPYVYRREATKVDINFTDECASKKCLQFSEFSQVFFDENKSSGLPENETITVPDIVTVARKNAYWTFGGIFTKSKASSFMWNMPLPIFYAIFRSPIGLLTNMNNSQDGPFTMNTGISDIAKLGHLEAFNEETKLDTWESEYANMINGTMDVVTPPGLKLGEKRYVFSAGACRSFSFTATEAVFSKDIPQFKLLKMTLDKEQLQSVIENPDNLAFYKNDPHTDNRIPSGFLPLKIKDFSIPIFISMPYFHLVENETKNSVIFESSTEPNLEPYFLVDPKSGFLMEVNIHYQINIFLAKEDWKFDRDLIIPLAYIKSIASAKKEDAQKLYWLAYELPATIRTCLRLAIGFLLTLGIMRFVFAIYIKYLGARVHRNEKSEITCSQNELTLSDRVLNDFVFSTLC
nr:hypothetical transcript [Hymenolepis microstoma]